MWTTFIVFFIILFTYIHIQDQLKTGEDLDIYEYEYASPKGLLEITQYKQPVLFLLHLPSIRGNEKLDPIFVKDVRDYYKIKNQENRVDSISLPHRSAKGLMETDTKSVFYSDRNQTSISKSETWTNWFESVNPFLQPAFTINREYDVLYGSQKTRTIATYHRESHVYLYLPQETNTLNIRVKMAPWKSRTFLELESDYTYYEFWSRINLYEKNDHVRCLDFIVNPGYVLYIPPYWFYSIEFQNNMNEVCMMKYTTGANLLANVKHIGQYHLQQQNIQEKWWKPLGIQYELSVPDMDLSQNAILTEVATTSDTKTIAEVLVSELSPK